MLFFCRKLRSSQPSQLLVNLCFGFLGIYMAYILALHATAVSGLCVLAGVLVHYFLLATFLIMAADAILIFCKLIFVFVTIRRYVLIAAVISWCKFLTFCSVYITLLCAHTLTHSQPKYIREKSLLKYLYLASSALINRMLSIRGFPGL